MDEVIIFEEDLNRLMRKGRFSTDDLMALGMTEVQATMLIKRLAADGYIRVMPTGIEEN